MPELPEVENVVKNINSQIKGKTLTDVKVYVDKIIKNCSKEEFINALKGQLLFEVKRRGKYIIFKYEKNAVICHLRMEGRFYFDELKGFNSHKYVLLEFIYDNKIVSSFLDFRKFATIELFSLEDVDKYFELKNIGPDGNTDIDPNLIFKKLHKKRKPIKTALLEQTLIAGIGNIYADEILFASKIHPKKLTCDLTIEEVKEIVKNTKIILNKAIEYGGSTVKSFEISHGNIGDFSRFLKVYNREKQKCINCQTTIIYFKIGGRGTRICPNCQIISA